LLSVPHAVRPTVCYTPPHRLPHSFDRLSHSRDRLPHSPDRSPYIPLNHSPFRTPHSPDHLPPLLQPFTRPFATFADRSLDRLLHSSDRLPHSPTVSHTRPTVCHTFHSTIHHIPRFSLPIHHTPPTVCHTQPTVCHTVRPFATLSDRLPQSPDRLPYIPLIPRFTLPIRLTTYHHSFNRSLYRLPHSTDRLPRLLDCSTHFSTVATLLWTVHSFAAFVDRLSQLTTVYNQAPTHARSRHCSPRHAAAGRLLHLGRIRPSTLAAPASTNMRLH
jgi:hypothetical protein